MLKNTLTLFAILALGILTFSSCGGDTKEASKTTTNTTPKADAVTTTPKADAAPVGEAVHLELAGTDKMTYDKTELKVKAGSKVTLTFTHIGKMPLSAMGHNFVLLKEGTDIAKFAMEAMKAKDNDYIPTSDAIIANTKMIGGGGSTEITFDAPAKGTYDFICSFPGHYSNMKGKFIVE